MAIQSIQLVDDSSVPRENDARVLWSDYKQIVHVKLQYCNCQGARKKHFVFSVQPYIW